jgi:polysaccharide biosynthesis/export protein
MGYFQRSVHLAATTIIIWSGPLLAQSVSPSPGGATTPAPAAAAGPTAAGVAALPDYVIGPDDVLSIFFWRDNDLSGDVTVRPDGKITLKVVNEIQAAGLTPQQLQETVTKAAARLFTDEPTVTVTVKQINSRKVYISGSVAKPGPYPLLEPTTVLQLIINAGGLSEFADKKHITIIRAEKRPDGQNYTLPFNYAEIMNRQNLKQNVELKPGDTVLVK